jgi:D-amino-acid dehydrogenase
MDRGASVLVLGAGVVGTASAFYLAGKGFQVTVVEARAGAGLETSFANGGLLTPSMADPWAAPGIPRKILAWLGREDAPFLVRPGAVPGLSRWGLRFLANCTPGAWRRNTAIILRLAGYSHRMLQALTRETGIAYDLNPHGTLHLFSDPFSMAAARRTAEVVGDLGVPFRALDADACAALEPALARQVGRISGGIHYPDDEAGDAHLFTRRLADHLAAGGVRFRYGETVTRIEVHDAAFRAAVTGAGRIEADACLVALGNSSAAVVRPIGLHLPIYPVKGYSITIPVGGWNGAPTVPLIDDGRKLGIIRLGERLRIAGTAEFTGRDTALNPKRIANLARAFLELFPDCPNRDAGQPWTGFRPMTPDGIPYLGATPVQGLYLNTGHGHLGWTMSCGSAKAVADVMAGEAPDIDLAGMTLDGR